MKINTDFILRELAGETILVPTGKTAQNFNGMLCLSETAAFIWKILPDTDGAEAVVRAVLDEYEVDEETARKDVEAFFVMAKENDLILS